MLTVESKWSVKRKDGRGTRIRCIAVCDCGDRSEYDYSNISVGNSTKCVECAKKSRSVAHTRHGLSHRSKSQGGKIYYTWRAMKKRCSNPNDTRYAEYGGRGIKVCDDWQDFEVFRSDMGEPPTNQHTIERLDFNKGYSKENCKWATIKEQANNKRSNRLITAFGETKNLQQWADETGIKRETIARRLNNGWNIERALTEKPKTRS